MLMLILSRMKLSVFLFAFFAISIMMVGPSFGANLLSSDGLVKREAMAAREPVLSRFARTAGTRGQGSHGRGCGIQQVKGV